MKAPYKYIVTCWHTPSDKTQTFEILARDTQSHGMYAQPSRTIAGIKARELFAETLGEDYNIRTQQILSIEEVL